MERKKSNYLELLKDPRWQKKRLEILQRDNFTCMMCDDDKHTLHIHHDEYIKGKMPWEYKNDTLRTLCEECHYLVSHYECGIDPLHKVVYKQNNIATESIIYVLAWPYDIDVYERTKTGEVRHILYLTAEYLYKIANFFEIWQKDLQTLPSTKSLL